MTVDQDNFIIDKGIFQVSKITPQLKPYTIISPSATRSVLEPGKQTNLTIQFQNSKTVTQYATIGVLIPKSMMIPLVKTEPQILKMNGVNIQYKRIQNPENFEAQFIQICASGQAGCPPGALNAFKITNLMNPSNINSNDSIILQIYSDYMELQELNANNISILPSMTTVFFQDLMINRDNNKGNSLTNFKVSFKLTKLYQINDGISINLPKQLFQFNTNIQCYVGDMEYNCLLIEEASTFTIEYSRICSVQPCIQNSEFELNLKLKNQLEYYSVQNLYMNINISNLKEKIASQVFALNFFGFVDPGQITPYSVESDSYLVSGQNILVKLVFDLKVQVPSQAQNGYITIIIPEKMKLLNPTSCYVEEMYCSVTKSGILIISYIDDSIDITTKQIEVQILDLQNPFDNEITSSFMISTYGKNQGSVVNGNLNIKDFTYQAFVTGMLQVMRIEKFLDSSEQNNKRILIDTQSIVLYQSTCTHLYCKNRILSQQAADLTQMGIKVYMEFEFQISNSIPVAGYIYFEIQKTLQIDFGPLIPYCYNLITDQTINCVRFQTGISIPYAICATQRCNRGSLFKIRIGNLVNPGFSVQKFLPENTFKIQTTNENGKSIVDQSPPGIFSSIYVLNKNIVIQTLLKSKDVLGVTVNLNLLIIAQSQLPFMKSVLSIQLPSNVLYMSKDTAFSALIDGNSVTYELYYYDDSSISKILLFNMCQLFNDCLENKQYAIKINGLQNPQILEDYSQKLFQISSNVQDYKNDIQVVDQVEQMIGVYFETNIAQTIRYFTVESDNPFTFQKSTGLIFTFENVLTIPQNSYLYIKFPIDFPSIQFQYSPRRCEGTIGFKSNQLVCQVWNKILIVKNCFNDVFQYPSVFQFKLYGIIDNPWIKKTYSEFKLSIFDKNHRLMENFNGFNSFTIYSNTSIECNQCKICDADDRFLCIECSVPSSRPFKDGSKCKVECESNQFMLNQYTPKCINCFTGCLTCTGPSSENCLNCKPGYVMDSGRCLNQCPLGTIQSNNQCINSNPQLCDSTCLNKICGSNPYYCQQCIQNYKFDNIIMRCEDVQFRCRGNFYYDDQRNQCLKCSVQCQTCQQRPDLCVLCSSFLGFPARDITDNNLCKNQCPAQTYNNNGICLACHQSCLECNGNQNYDCTKCFQQDFLKYLQYGYCVNQCESGYNLRNGTCYQICSNTNCYQCNPKNTQQCTQCRDPTPVFHNDNCIRINDCESNFYASIDYSINFEQNYNQMTCQRCSNVKCNTCPGDKCDSCINKLNNPGSFNQYEFFYENDCYQQCPPGFSADYTDDMKCKPFVCEAPCRLCGSGKNHCYACISILPWLYEAKCLDKCNDGSYGIQNFQCDKCSDNCENCVNTATQCTSCKFPLKLYQQKCISRCPPDVIDLGNRCKDKVFDTYEAEQSTCAVLFLISVFYMIYSYAKAESDNPFNFIHSCVFFLSILQTLTKILLFHQLLLREEKWSITLMFMTILSSPLISLIMKQFYFGLFEEYLVSFKFYMMENPTFYKYSSYCLVIFGPNFSRIYHGGIYGVPASEFYKYKAYQNAVNRMMFYTSILSLVQCYIDTYCLMKFKLTHKIYHIAYWDLFFNGSSAFLYVLHNLIEKYKLIAQYKQLEKFENF